MPDMKFEIKEHIAILILGAKYKIKNSTSSRNR